MSRKIEYGQQLGFNQVAHAKRVLMIDLVFEFAGKLGLRNCFRCGKPLYRDDFTIDHIIAWRNKPNAKDLFFDLENIRFSHQRCNSSATFTLPSENLKHGYPRYAKGCRCSICTEGHKKRISERRKLGKMK